MMNNHIFFVIFLVKMEKIELFSFFLLFLGEFEEETAYIISGGIK